MSLKLQAGCGEFQMVEDQSLEMTREEGIRTVYDDPSHVGILGAGASIATTADNPEPSRKKLPSMEKLHQGRRLGGHL